MSQFSDTPLPILPAAAVALCAASKPAPTWAVKLIQVLFADELNFICQDAAHVVNLLSGLGREGSLPTR